MRFLFYLVVLFVVYLVWRWSDERYKKRYRGEGWAKKETKASELVQDPVCKTYVPKEQAVEFDGHYFCSEECKDAYLGK
jgi:hypothetical protein